MTPRLTGLLFVSALCWVATPLPQRPFPEELELAQANLPPGLSEEAPPFPQTKGRGYPHLFTRKTSALLSEALGMLHRVKDIKERQWLETFIHRLGGLAVDLEKSTGQKSGLPQIAANELGPLFPSNSQQNEVVPSLSIGSAPLASEPKEDLIQQLHSQPLLKSLAGEQEVREGSEPTARVENKMKHSMHSREQARKQLLGQLREQVKQLRDLSEAKQVQEPVKRHHPSEMYRTVSEDQQYGVLPDQPDDFDTEEEGAATGELEDEDIEANTGAPSLIATKSSAYMANSLAGPQEERIMPDRNAIQQAQGGRPFPSKDNLLAQNNLHPQQPLID